ncbi:MAG TPA: hypothetical protein VGP05_08105, partial [Pseudonocardia sp.]|nr:hypothetical protein [Pseudonocardia sp.]
TISPPPFNWVGAFGVLFIALAFLLELAHFIRQRRKVRVAFAPVERAAPVRATATAPAHVVVTPAMAAAVAGGTVAGAGSFLEMDPPTEAIPIVAPPSAPTAAPTAAPTQSPTQAPTTGVRWPASPRRAAYVARATIERADDAAFFEPVSIKSPASGPATPGTAATEPAATEPATFEPATSEPAAAKPATSEPATSEPAAAKPADSEPQASEPAAETEPAADLGQDRPDPATGSEPEPAVGESARWRPSPRPRSRAMRPSPRPRPTPYRRSNATAAESNATATGDQLETHSNGTGPSGNGDRTAEAPVAVDAPNTGAEANRHDDRGDPEIRAAS